MLSVYFHQIKLLIKRLLLIYLAYFICRVLFFAFNHQFFNDLSVLNFLKISFFALRFDTFSIFICNSLFILLSILPFNFFNTNKYQNVLKWLYFISNSIFLIFNLVDIAYFPYIKKRSTADILKQLGGQTDMAALLPQYIKDFWYLVLILAFIIWGVNKIYPKNRKEYSYEHSLLKSGALSLVFIFIIGLTVLGIRGGFQRVPIDVVDAGKYAEQQNINLVLNTPFSIIKSLEKNELKKLDFDIDKKFSKEFFNPVKKYNGDTINKQNIVILILESFSKEYTKLGKVKSYTPFLDSLMDHSLVFTNAYSNGHKSIEGIPAILSSMPSFMENPFINSAYSTNQYNSLAALLKKEKYSTAFFHGGINGTMSFDSYAKQAGYDEYFGKNEYNNDEDFDGFWGIWDENFFKFSISKINEMKLPFHASIFTLSSHHPYLIPDKYKNKFPKGTLENHESIGYADYALRKFFLQAKEQKWFNNTLFVICADHCSISEHPFFSNNLGQFNIPILFYKGDNSLKGSYDKVFQQSDIMPSILNYINYNKQFYCFGNSYKDTANRYINYYANGTHYLLNDSLVFCFNNYELDAVFNYKKDSLMYVNIKSDGAAYKAPVNYFKDFIQNYNNSIINNDCHIK